MISAERKKLKDMKFMIKHMDQGFKNLTLSEGFLIVASQKFYSNKIGEKEESTYITSSLALTRYICYYFQRTTKHKAQSIKHNNIHYINIVINEDRK